MPVGCAAGAALVDSPQVQKDSTCAIFGEDPTKGVGQQDAAGEGLSVAHRDRAAAGRRTDYISLFNVAWSNLAWS
jgi:hypothetical protein